MTDDAGVGGAPEQRPQAYPVRRPRAPKPGRPHAPAWELALALVIGSVLFAAFVHWSKGFIPRVKTIDALAGLTIAALIVDRLLTFVPPIKVRDKPAEREADLRVLRLGFGAAIGAALVSVTNLKAVSALTASPIAIDGRVDRGIAVLAIAGGVAGLASLLGAINPKPATDAESAKAADKEAPADQPKPDAPHFPPTRRARLLGVLAVLAAAALALLAAGDKDGLDLLHPSTQADGSVLLVVRFGTILLAAAIVQQLVEQFVSPRCRARDKAVLTGAAAVVLGVLAGRVMDLFLLHSIGFFGAAQHSVDQALALAHWQERWLDAFLTGLVIAAGTKPLSDLASRFSKVKQAAA
jgi:hypothetical protein